jgi:penicillin-binding protein 1A
MRALGPPSPLRRGVFPEGRTSVRWLIYLFSLLLFGAVGVAGAGLWVLHEYGRALPDYHQLADYEPPVVTRVHAGDGSLVAEYARERRVFVPIDAMPRRVIKAFLSAEDKNFYSHPGVDPLSLIAAVIDNVRNYGTNRRPRGASTITQQVAKNFLLTNEVSLARKIKEAILAFRIERAFTKDRILELYLNEIYLGQRSYGVAAAAINYYDKSLNDLTIAEAAYLAALPKAPNNYNPERYYDAAIVRRNWVIEQMQRNGFITDADAEVAQAAPLGTRPRSETAVADAGYFAEEVRRELLERYGEGKLYEGGLSVRTTLDPALQVMADRALRQGLIEYDRRHGWRGPVATVKVEAGWGERLEQVVRPSGTPEQWRLALVVAVDDGAAQIGFPDGRLASIPLAELKWAREPKDDQKLGPSVRAAGQVLQRGAVVLVEPVDKDADGKPYPEGTHALRQIPEVGGALVALDPHTGRVLAMSGGWDFNKSEFNRATQAMRQPGSSFKPFVYMPALDSGFTPATRVLDAPFVIDQGPGLGKWKPANYEREFYGPIPMRVGIEHSRNLMTVRLAQTIGMDIVADYAKRFGVVDNLARQLAMSLGAGETTLLRITTAYAMMVNGGKRIAPTLIDRIQDRNGRTVMRHDQRACDGCDVAWNGQSAAAQPPEIPDTRASVVDPATAYQMVRMLEGVVLRGTGRALLEIGKPLGGKTGTTNDYTDAWFVGFTPDLAAGVYVGFDQPRTLGHAESGSRAALPIFKRFMASALERAPQVPFRTPPGIRLVRINQETGALARPGDRKVIVEAFKPGTEPTGETQIIDGGIAGDDEAAVEAVTPVVGAPVKAPVAGTASGLY